MQNFFLSRFDLKITQMWGFLGSSFDRAAANRWWRRGRLWYIPLAGLHQDRDKQVESFIQKTESESDVSGVVGALSTNGMW